jgi:hypothetical protein
MKNQRVKMTRKCLNDTTNNIMEYYSNPLNGRIKEDHHEEIACLLWSCYNSVLPEGVILSQSNDDIFHVSFDNDVGSFDGYYEKKDLVFIKEKKHGKPSKKKN